MHRNAGRFYGVELFPDAAPEPVRPAPDFSMLPVLSVPWRWVSAPLPDWLRRLLPLRFDEDELPDPVVESPRSEPVAREPLVSVPVALPVVEPLLPVPIPVGSEALPAFKPVVEPLLPAPVLLLPALVPLLPIVEPLVPDPVVPVPSLPAPTLGTVDPLPLPPVRVGLLVS
ncbi:MAG TPA: hypothetical protein VFH68_04205 [Polyangia bacterium]|nr:hypothetical protein [Polyangia bacterium]